MATKKTDKSSKSKPPVQIKTSLEELSQAAESLAADTRVEKFVEPLDVKLTDVELKSKSRRAAQIGSMISQKEAEVDSIKKRYKAEVEALANEREVLDAAIREESERRPVECERIYRYRLLEVDEVRCDTGESLGRRAMTKMEAQTAQTDLFDDEKKPQSDLPPLDDDEDPEPFI
jgi:hypothetical protein